MSKRFGRNQKRAMRSLLSKAEDKIVSLSHRVRNSEDEIKELRNKLLRHNALIDTILAIIPEHFCALTADTMENVPDGQTRVNLIKRLPKSHREFSGFEPEVSAKYQSLFHALDILRIDIDEGRDPILFREMKHVVVQFKSKYCALAVSPEALRFMPIEKLSRDVAHLIKQHLTSKGQLCGSKMQDFTNL